VLGRLYELTEVMFRTILLISIVILGISAHRLQDTNSNRLGGLGLDKRQSLTCEEQYGQGYIQCHPGKCYNPNAGESCCGDGGELAVR
jgi:hypothetical protein